jgi:hypothetical protein
MDIVVAYEESRSYPPPLHTPVDVAVLCRNPECHKQFEFSTWGSVRRVVWARATRFGLED